MKPEKAEPLSEDVLAFSPGLLSIQESPPAKLPRTIFYSVALLFIILLVWAIFGKLDIVATAEGRLVPESYIKIVQPAEGGVVQDILVHEGQVVEAGQVLIRMDAKLTESDVRAVRNEYQLKRMQLRRIDAELSGLPMKQMEEDPLELYPQVEQQYLTNIKAYRDTFEQEQATLSKVSHDLRASEAILKKLKEVAPSFRRSLTAYEKLGEDGYVSTIALEEKQREMLEKTQDLNAQESRVSSLTSTRTVSEKKLARITSSYRSELQNERIETESQAFRLREELEKVEHRSDRLVLRAPQAGIVKDLATHTRGTVVSPGTVLVSLVPQDEPLQAEVLVRNEDVGFVHVEQRVKLKFAAYSFQKYGMINGTVIHVGADATDNGAQPPGQSGESPDMSAGYRYKALVRLDAQYLDTNGQQMHLTPGMLTSAEIHLGYRTVMEYLLSPTQKAWQEAGRER
ncbi:MAG: HlyD family type I secretion periplasmic adaptor subunit [Sedimenticola sp.]